MGRLKVFPTLIIFAILVLSLVTRLSLYNPNALYFFSDEARFDDLVLSWGKGKLEEDSFSPLKSTFNIQARPMFGLIYTLPAFFQSKNPKIPYGAYLNILINTLIVLFAYLIVKKIAGLKAAVLAFFFILCSSTYSAYIRHMLPYDLGLLFLLVGGYAFLRFKLLFLAGLMLSLGYLSYPGYLYYFLPLPPLILILSFKKHLNLSPVLKFLFGLGLPVALAEIISRLLSQTSYFEIAKALSGTVIQGDFIRASTFIKEYIIVNDGLLGLILSISSLFIIFLKNKNLALFFGLYLLSIFLILEIASDITHQTVLYGRTIRPFYLLLLVSAATILNNLFNRFKPWVGNFFFCLLILLIIINFWPRYIAFKNSIYPKDFDKQAKSMLNSTSNLAYVFSNKSSEVDKKQNQMNLAKGKYYIVNADLLYPYYGNKKLLCKKQILLEKSHILTGFPPYLFEGFTLRMRYFIIKDPPSYELIHCS